MNCSIALLKPLGFSKQQYLGSGLGFPVLSCKHILCWSDLLGANFFSSKISTFAEEAASNPAEAVRVARQGTVPAILEGSTSQDTLAAVSHRHKYVNK